MQRIKQRTLQNVLAVGWFFGAGLIAVILATQTYAGKYGDETDKVWQWFLPTVGPTTGLILGSKWYASVTATDAAAADTALAILALAATALYVAAVGGVLGLEPYVSSTPLQLMDRSKYFLGPFQGVVTALLGAAFISSAKG